MIKTHKKSKIIQFHHNSNTSSELLDPDKKSEYIVLQLESVQHQKCDFIAEIIHEDDYENIGLEKDIKFLKELQEELKTQDNDCQASPRYWTVGDYRMVPCPEGCQDDYYIDVPESEYFGKSDSYLEYLKEYEVCEWEGQQLNDFNDICNPESALSWIQDYIDDGASLIPVKEEHFIHPNTMFLTKAEAKKHIEVNHYHYSPKVHTYAMTAWRAPKVERLMKILESFDWDSLNMQSK